MQNKPRKHTNSRDWTVERIGPYRLLHHRRFFPLTKDPLLLSEFVLPLKRDDRVIDIGTGTAVIPLILAWKSEVQSITGVEVQRRVFEVAQRNVGSNGLNERISILEADYRDLVNIYPPMSFTLVVSNPPYIKNGSGRLGPSMERAVARHEVLGTLRELFRVTAHLLTPDGRASFIYPLGRLEEVMEALDGVGLRARRLRFVHAAGGKGARLFMVEAGFNGSGLRIEEPVSM